MLVLWKALLEEQRSRGSSLAGGGSPLREVAENNTAELFKIIFSTLHSKTFLTHSLFFFTKSSHCSLSSRGSSFIMM